MDRVIYEPRGAAAEYSPLAANLYRGCTHRCRYCYVPGVLRMDRAEFHSVVIPRPGVMAQLTRDVGRLAVQTPLDLGCQALPDGNRSVLLSFTCDPFPQVEAQHGLTLAAIRELGAHRIPCVVLTKAGARSLAALPALKEAGGRYGISLVWHDDRLRQEWEPGAASVDERIATAGTAAAMGIPVFVSVEPVIDPAEGMAAIRSVMGIATDIRVGKLNHMEPPRPVDWRAFALQARNELIAWAALRPGRTFRLKHGLAELVVGEPVIAGLLPGGNG